MQYYTLDDKAADASFLAGETVSCPVALRPDELARGGIQEGNMLVVILSNRAKYKGRITRYTYVLQGGYAVGSMEIVRV